VPAAHAPTSIARASARQTGWRERIEPGIYRAHRVACPASRDHRAGRRCACSFQILVPGKVPGRTKMLTIHGTVTEARAVKRRLQAQGRPQVPRDEHPDETLDVFAARYLRAKSATFSPHTIKSIETEYRLRIAPTLGPLCLSQITRERVELWLAELVGRASSRRMVTQGVATLRMILSTAVSWGRIATNPAARLRLPAPETQVRQRVERVLTEAQLATLYRDGPGTLRIATMLRAAAEGGLRRGEIIGLRWDDVDLAGRRIHVRRSVWHVDGKVGEKTVKGRRSRKVAISEATARLVADWHDESVTRGGADPQGYVWPGRRRGPMHAHAPTHAVMRAMARAGLVDKDGKPLVSLHGLRHTCGSILLARGVPLIVVSRHLGHADPNITARVYAHLLSETQLDEAAEVFACLAARP
jgi:integrase